MNSFVKWTLGILGVLVALVGFFVILFIVEMTPSQEKEEEITRKATAYLKSHYSGQMEIYDTLFDNMGNFEFEYAAKVSNRDNGVSFLIYENSLGKMVDDYAVSYYEHELHNKIADDIKERFSEIEIITVSYAGTSIEGAYIGEVDLPKIQEVGATPSLMIWLDRGSEANDEDMVDELIDRLKYDIGLPHATISVEYTPNSNEQRLSKQY
ncbi:hypothetical protein N781_16130 [Pontibacillus halophilus JSM 076056 = DSM 19796]|uniref:Uncharacterized protein n=1 Tax=Pontibacillus halophilus JSM 076056 = DSM 19796 TaxID=1385510 RepID=A0A0A5G679_9BACI|nr:hypothetical protein [Pontibacillus halophilus]KGX86683.1 hypothetical protein N781_16130 [Pontibacillus halophilus JSM 076056 = DSM 19796]